MESLQQIKQRKKSVQNIGTITKAMELVAATKMRRSQEITLLSRPYATAILTLLSRLLFEEKSGYVPALLKPRVAKKKLYVVITSDKGLAGAFNNNVLKAFENFLKENNAEKFPAIAVGEKAHDYLLKNNFSVVGHFVHFGDYTTPEEIRPLSQLITKGYLEEEWDEVFVFSTNFVNALKQKVVVHRLLPLTLDALREDIQELVPTSGRYAAEGKNLLPEIATKKEEYLIEPSPEEVLDELVPHLIEMDIYHLMLEANASEHSARRLAMKNASDNADSLKDELTLAYNKSRQAVITREIIEITSGVELMKK